MRMYLASPNLFFCSLLLVYKQNQMAEYQFLSDLSIRLGYQIKSCKSDLTRQTMHE